MRVAAVILLSAVTLAACKTAPLGGPEVESTWKGADVAIPMDYGANECAGRVMSNCLERLNPPRKLPVVVYAHGCTGPRLCKNAFQDML